MTLTDLGIEDLPKQKYAVECPKCASSRQKSGTKSLMVYKDPDCIRIQCLHPGCEYETRQKLHGVETVHAAVEKLSFIAPVPTQVMEPKPGPFSISYDYRNKDGELLYKVYRLETPRGKRFFPMGYTTKGWVKSKPDVKALYKAEKISSNKPILVVEGEKAADAAEKLLTKVDVITWHGGANGIKGGDWELLKDMEIILWPDNDEAGVAAMHEIANLIPSNNISIIDVSVFPEKSDLADDLDRNTIVTQWKSRKKIEKASALSSLSVDDILGGISQMSAGRPTGYVKHTSLKFPDAGLVSLEGRSKHGKSAFLVDMLRRQMAVGKGPFIFYSYEMPIAHIMMRLVMSMEGKILSPDEAKNVELYREGILNGQFASFEKLKERIGKDVFFIDKPRKLGDLVQDIKDSKSKGGTFFIDYIQQIPTDEPSQSRYLEIKKIVHEIQSAAYANNVLVLAAVQLGKSENPLMDKPREGADIVFASSLVLRIWNKTQGELEGSKRDDLNEFGGNAAVEVRYSRYSQPGAILPMTLFSGARLEEV